MLKKLDLCAYRGDDSGACGDDSWSCENSNFWLHKNDKIHTHSHENGNLVLFFCINFGAKLLASEGKLADRKSSLSEIGVIPLSEISVI